MRVNRIWNLVQVAQRKPHPRHRSAIEAEADLQVVYDRIADLASDHLIRESGCVPPPRTHDPSPVSEPMTPREARSLWASALSGLLRFVRDILFGRGQRAAY